MKKRIRGRRLAFSRGSDPPIVLCLCRLRVADNIPSAVVVGTWVRGRRRVADHVDGKLARDEVRRHHRDGRLGRGRFEIVVVQGAVAILQYGVEPRVQRFIPRRIRGNGHHRSLHVRAESRQVPFQVNLRPRRTTRDFRCRTPRTRCCPAGSTPRCACR